MGVDGFREDVITFISKKLQTSQWIILYLLPMECLIIKMGRIYMNTWEEFRQVCDEYDCFQLGEGPMTTTKSLSILYGGESKTLDLMFHFDHMMADCLFTEYIQRPFRLKRLKKAFSKWQHAVGKSRKTTTISGKSWSSADNQQIRKRRVYSWKRNHLWQSVICFNRAHPFIYRGQEIGMTNIRLKSIDQYIDVSSKVIVSLPFMWKTV